VPSGSDGGRRRCAAIDARKGRAAVWYASYGAVPLLDALLSLLLPFATIQSVLTEAGKL
jgi:hypothetical protein